MAYGCRPTCDHCRPKYLHCPACGTKNFLVMNACKRCGRVFTQQDRDEAVRLWESHQDARTSSACFMPQGPTD